MYYTSIHGTWQTLLVPSSISINSPKPFGVLPYDARKEGKRKMPDRFNLKHAVPLRRAGDCQLCTFLFATSKARSPLQSRRYGMSITCHVRIYWAPRLPWLAVTLPPSIYAEYRYLTICEFDSSLTVARLSHKWHPTCNACVSLGSCDDDDVLLSHRIGGQIPSFGYSLIIPSLSPNSSRWREQF